MDATRELAGRYLNAGDLHGKAVRVTVLRVTQTKFRDGTSKLVLGFEGAKKELALNKTNLRAVIAVLGAETDAWPGGRLTLQPQKVDFGGQLVDAVRIAAPAAPPVSRPAPPPPPPPQAPSREPGADDEEDDLGF